MERPRSRLAAFNRDAPGQPLSRPTGSTRGVASRASTGARPQVVGDASISSNRAAAVAARTASGSKAISSAGGAARTATSSAHRSARTRSTPPPSTSSPPRPTRRTTPRISTAGSRRGPAYGLVLLGDPPSFDEDVSDPQHCCVQPLDAVGFAVQCGDRTVSVSTWAAGLLFGADGVAVTVFSTVRPGCLPSHHDGLDHHDSFGFHAGLLLCPVVPRERCKGLTRPHTA